MVKVICINDKDRPSEIPKSKWPIKGNFYNIIHVYIHPMQLNIQGVELKELKLNEENYPYSSYKLSRFAVTSKEDLDSLIELMSNCSDLNEIDIERLIEEEELITDF